MKKIIWVLIIILMITLSIDLFYIHGNMNEKIAPPVTKKATIDLPMTFFAYKNLKYNPMYPYKTERDPMYVDNSISMFTKDQEIQVFVDKTAIISPRYKIIKPDSGLIVKSKAYKAEEIYRKKEGSLLEISTAYLKDDTRYVMELSFIYNDEKIFYYQNFYIGDSHQQVLIEDYYKAHNTMFNGNVKYKDYINGNNSGGVFYQATQDSSEDVLMWKGVKVAKMQTPIPVIKQYDLKDGSFEIDTTFVIANRVEEVFEYWDFKETYEGKVSKKGIDVQQFNRIGNRKNHTYFDKEKQNWVIDEGAKIHIEEQVTSENGHYVAFVYKGELWLNDYRNNELVLLYNLDHIDDDYFFDEHQSYNIKIQHVSNNGEVLYGIYGYFGKGEHAGETGIKLCYYRYFQEDNRGLIFLPLPYNKQSLKSVMEQSIQYFEAHHTLLLQLNGKLLKINLMKEELLDFSSFSNEDFQLNQGILYNYKKEKNNRTIWIKSLIEELSVEKEIYFENAHVQLIQTLEDGSIIGVYNASDTYEYLDGSVFFPYQKIVYLDNNGNILKEYTAKAEQYLGNIIVNEIIGSIRASVYTLEKNIDSRPSTSTVNYKWIDNIYLWPYRVKKNGKMEKDILNYNDSSEKRQLIIQNSKEPKINKTYIKHILNKKNIVKNKNVAKSGIYYEIVKGTQVIEQVNNFSNALKEMIKLNGDYIFSRDMNGKRKTILGKNILKEMQIHVPVYSQQQELPRGDEVTSLAMLLSYQLYKPIDKMDLARELKYDLTKYKVINGILVFGDMHQGFVGSIDDVTMPGYGVYIEPIFELAKKYSNGSILLEDVPYEAILKLIGNGYPVQVIKAQMKSISNSESTALWHTEHGYMEVLPNNHSVVIVGYDKKYIYYNNPYSGKKEKSTHDVFEKNWNTLGKQSLIVLH